MQRSLDIHIYVQRRLLVLGLDILGWTDCLEHDVPGVYGGNISHDPLRKRKHEAGTYIYVNTQI